MLPVSTSVQQAKPGMIVVDDVYSPSGLLVVRKNTVLNPRHISKMKLYNVKSIYVLINDDFASEQDLEKEDEANNPILTSQEFKVFRRSFVNSAADLAACFETVLKNPEAATDYSSIVSQVVSMAENVQGTMYLMELLNCMRNYDDTVYVHSISVALVARSIGVRIGLSDSKLNELMLACILHDIGKLQIPQDILNKPTKLTNEEFQLIKMHPQKGYEMLRNANLSKDVLLAILLHHERCDGSGYPSGITGNQIPLFAKIIAIADVYDAMTARRSYRKEICSFEVISIFEQEGYQKYESALLIPFLENIAQSHINVKVRLSNSLIGTVVMINQHKLSKPIVNVDGQFYDLSKQKDITIVKVL